MDLRNMVSSIFSTGVGGATGVLARIQKSPRVAKLGAGLAAVSVPIGLFADGLSIFGEGSRDREIVATATPTSDDLETTASSSELPLLSDAISINYMRTFGAWRSTMLMWSIRAGGYEELGDGFGELRGSGLRITGELPAFYEQWKYKNIQLLENGLWGGPDGRDLFADLAQAMRTEDREAAANCVNSQLAAFYEGPTEFDFECSIDEQDNIGYLSLILEGVADISPGLIRISFVRLDEESTSFQWESYSLAEVASLCAEIDPALNTQDVHGVTVTTQSLAGIATDEDYLWPVAIYQTEPEDTLRGRLIDDARIPICLFAEGRQTMVIRPPGREDAITVPLPDGWYWQ